MNSKQLFALRELARLDVDAINAYDSAIARISVPAIRDRLTAFRVDHTRHVHDLNQELQRVGAEPVEIRSDLKGVVLKGLTAVTSMMGVRGALLAMVGNEELTTHAYQAALRLEWPPETRALIDRNHGDERRHLEWMKEALKNPAWAERDATNELPL